MGIMQQCLQRGGAIHHRGRIPNSFGTDHRTNARMAVHGFNVLSQRVVKFERAVGAHTAYKHLTSRKNRGYNGRRGHLKHGSRDGAHSRVHRRRKRWQNSRLHLGTPHSRRTRNIIQLNRKIISSSIHWSRRYLVGDNLRFTAVTKHIPTKFGHPVGDNLRFTAVILTDDRHCHLLQQ